MCCLSSEDGSGGEWASLGSGDAETELGTEPPESGVTPPEDGRRERSGDDAGEREGDGDCEGAEEGSAAIRCPLTARN